MRGQVDLILGRVAVAGAIALIGVAGGTAVAIVRPEFLAYVAPERAVPYPVGSKIDIDSHLYQSHPRTILIFGRSSCSACAAATDFHRAIATAAGPQSIQTLWISTSSDSVSEVAHANTLGLRADQVEMITPRSLRLRKVPTVVIVDAAGIIQASWEGGLTGPQQQDVMDLLVKPTDIR